MVIMKISKKILVVLALPLIIYSCKKHEAAAVIVDEKAVKSEESSEYTNEFIPDALINDSNVRLRLEPDLNCEVITLLDTGTMLKVIGQSGWARVINEKGKIWFQVVLENGLEGWVYGDYVSFFETEKMELDSSVINVTTLKKAGLEKVNKISRIIEKLTDEQMEDVTSLGITESAIVSFKGIEKLTNLHTISISYSQIAGLNEIEGTMGIENLIFENCKIDDLSKIKDFRNLKYLNLDGSSVDRLDVLIFPEGLKIINLTGFPQYRTIINELPVEIEQVYLNYNGIDSVGDFEILKNKYHELIRVFIEGNNIAEEILKKEAPGWMPVILNWGNDEAYLDPRDFIIDE
jgi:hypothetical protein